MHLAGGLVASPHSTCLRGLWQGPAAAALLAATRRRLRQQHAEVPRQSRRAARRFASLGLNPRDSKRRRESRGGHPTKTCTRGAGLRAREGNQGWRNPKKHLEVRIGRLDRVHVETSKMTLLVCSVHQACLRIFYMPERANHWLHCAKWEKEP